MNVSYSPDLFMVLQLKMLKVTLECHCFCDEIS